MKFIYAFQCFRKNVRRMIDSDYKLRKRLNRIKFIASIVVVIGICIALNYKKLSLEKEQHRCEAQLEIINNDLQEEEARVKEIEEYRAYV